MHCPRCSDVELDRGAMQGLEACSRCGGVSIDGAALFVACPYVAGLDRRALEIQLLGRKGEGIAVCPRCTNVPFEFDVLEVPIDWCAACGAVWIDGDEREALSVRDVRPDLGAGRPTSAYRTDARATRKAPRCADCGDVLVIQESYATERGLVCRPCRARDALDKAAPLVQKSGGWWAELVAWLRAVALEQSEALRRRDRTLP